VTQFGFGWNNQLPPEKRVAVPSRIFRDGTGIFVVKLSQSLRIEFRLACPDACYDSGSLGVIV
jgi:hypothetical protein